MTQPDTAPEHKQKPPTPPAPPPPARPAGTQQGTGAGGGAGRLPSRATSTDADGRPITAAACAYQVTYSDGTTGEFGSRLEAQAEFTRAGGRRIDPL